MRNILLDRDGTIIYDRHYLSRPEGVCLLPRAGEGLARLSLAGYRLFMISNQSGVGRGLFAKSDFERVQARLRSLLQAHAVSLEDEAACFHTPEDGCRCRKPGPGLWEQLARKHGLLAEESLIIGDKDADIQCARRAGMRGSILVLSGHGREQLQAQATGGCPREFGLGRHPSLIATDLKEACAWILRQDLQPGG